MKRIYIIIGMLFVIPFIITVYISASIFYLYKDFTKDFIRYSYNNQHCYMLKNTQDAINPNLNVTEFESLGTDSKFISDLSFPEKFFERQICIKNNVYINKELINDFISSNIKSAEFEKTNTKGNDYNCLLMSASLSGSYDIRENTCNPKTQSDVLKYGKKEEGTAKITLTFYPANQIVSNIFLFFVVSSFIWGWLLLFSNLVKSINDLFKKTIV